MAFLLKEREKSLETRLKWKSRLSIYINYYHLTPGKKAILLKIILLFSKKGD